MKAQANRSLKIKHLCMPSFKYYYPILLILLVALGLRLWGIGHGMPYVYDPDEPNMVVLAGGMLGNMDFNPHWFGHPATTLIYMLAGLDVLIYIFGLLFGVFKSPQDFRVFYHNDPSILYIGGRILIVLFSVASIYLIYRITEKIISKKAGYLAAVLLAIAPLHVSFSKYVRSDIMMTFFILLAFYFCLKILREEGIWPYIWAGFFTGLGIVTKYPAALFFSIIVFAHFLRYGLTLNKFRFLIFSGLACLVGMFIGSPFLFLDYKTAIFNVLYEGRSEHLGADTLDYLGRLWFYIKTLADQVLTWPGLIIAFIGGIVGLIKKNKPLILAFTFFVLFLLSISALSLNWDRWVIPVTPFVCLLFTWAAIQVMELISRQKNINPKWVSWVASLAILLVTLPMLYSTVMDSLTLAGDDTRTMTNHWVTDNLTPGRKILMEIYTPIFPKEAFIFYYVGQNGDLVRFDPNQSYKNIFKAPGHIGDLVDIGQIKSEGINYMILGSMYNRYLNEQEKFRKEVMTYQDLVSQAKIVFKASPLRGAIAGPEVIVYSFSNN